MEKLDNVKELVIQQHLSKTEAFTGWEKINRYSIWNAQTGEQLFGAAENSISCCTRNYCGNLREFTIPFTNENGQEAFRLEKPRAMVSGGCCS